MKPELLGGCAIQISGRAPETNPAVREFKPYLWVLAALIIGAVAVTNQFYQPRISLGFAIAAWVADMLLVFFFSLHPIGQRVGVLLAGLFLAVPCFVSAIPLLRCLLMCFAFLPFAIIAIPLLNLPNASSRERLIYLATWMGTREVKRRTRGFDATALLQLIAATAVFIGAIAIVKAVTPHGLWYLVRWLAGGIMIFAFAEMATAFHTFLTALMGIVAPGLLKSPCLSESITAFWTRRWNPATSELLRTYIFTSIPRRFASLALFMVFFVSATGHTLLVFMGLGKWNISLVCGAFFLVQPLFIVTERQLGVRRWPLTTRRLWTLSLLTVSSPLFVEPALQVIEPAWRAPDRVLQPAVCVLAFIILVSGLFSLAARVSLPNMPGMTRVPLK